MTVTIAVICVVAAICVIFLGQHRPEFALLLSAAAGILTLLYLLAPIIEIVDNLKVRLDSAGLGNVYATLLKTVGICYITDFAADLCRDFGQSSLAAKMEIAGKISIVALCFPLVDTLLGITDKLIG